jgi:hypothetical protein
MKATLKDIKVLVEQELDIDIKDRSRAKHQAFSRAVYCKIARDHRYSYADIGMSIGRDHATVLNSVKNTFGRAMDYDLYQQTYSTIRLQLNRNIPIGKLGDGTNIKVRNLIIENERLKTRVRNLVKNPDRFYTLTKHLDSDQLEDVFSRVRLMIRMMNG